MSRADGFTALDADTARRWERFGRQEQTLYPNLLGLQIEEVRVDYCRMRMPFRTELLQAGGVVHGGAIASLLDAVLVPAVGAGLAPGARYSTVDLHVQYLGSLVDADAVAEGWVTRRGRNIVFCESEAIDASRGRVVARSVLTYFVAT